jgi:hypothetical protein
MLYLKSHESRNFRRWGMSDTDKETQAIGQIATIVGSLEEDQRGRVIRYILDRFNIVDGSKPPKIAANTAHPEPQAEASAEFEDFASLVDAAGPKTDVQRALVAGYWLQVCGKAQSFDAQSANTELKHLGHASANITVALSALIDQKPALVLQLRKSGNTKQARKSYKLTETGGN